MPEFDDSRYRNCRLCPRNCGVDRTSGATGFCGETAVCRIAHAGPHLGEEPSFTGTRGSGTIFFTGCACRCFFCQNHQISLGHEGTAVSLAELVRRAEDLIARGVHNLNWVTPDHFWPHLRYLGQILRAKGYTLPFIYNCSGFMRPELVPEVAETVDIFLPDYKYADPELSRRCMGTPEYPDIAFAALQQMVSAKGFLQPWDPEGRHPAQKGVLVRHLVLPGQVANSLAVLRRLHAEFGTELPLSVMSQYRPVPACNRQVDFNRILTAEEYRQVYSLVESLGFENIYFQELRDDTDFLPDFNAEEPFAGNKN